MSERAYSKTRLLLAWLSAGIVVVAWIVIGIAGDRVWWSVPLLYGPRWIWVAPILGTLPLLFKSIRAGLLPLLLSVILLMFGILDFRTGLGHLTAPKTSNLRVLEFNAEGDFGNPGKTEKLIAYIAAEDPDIVVMAECTAKTIDALAEKFSQYQHHGSTSVCLFTKGELVSWDLRDPRDYWERYGSAAIVRATVRYKEMTFRVGLVHLATPRRALAKYNDSTQMESMRTSTTTNIILRDDESASARRWITEGDSLPTLIAGDFNLPVSSAIYRRHWGDLQNAFSSTGVGLGHTKMVTLWGIRIDHVLTLNGVRAVRAWIGPDLGSDHLPLRADLLIERK